MLCAVTRVEFTNLLRFPPIILCLRKSAYGICAFLCRVWAECGCGFCDCCTMPRHRWWRNCLGIFRCHCVFGKLGFSKCQVNVCLTLQVFKVFADSVFRALPLCHLLVNLPLLNTVIYFRSWLEGCKPTTPTSEHGSAKLRVAELVRTSLYDDSDVGTTSIRAASLHSSLSSADMWAARTPSARKMVPWTLGRDI